MSTSSERFDLAIVGAGFGGLGMALRAAELGLSVVVLESLAYPGGCASTYVRRGVSYEAGATLFSGLHAGGFFGRALHAHGVNIDVAWLDPVLIARTPNSSLSVPRDRAAFVASWAALEPEHFARIERFFAVQARIANALWGLFEEPTLLPPLSLRALATHLQRLPRYLELLPWLGRSLGEMLEDFGLAHARTLRAYLDALCQITVQAPVAEAEASFALAAIDYPFRGTAHVRGGIGRLASGMVQAISHAGGEVRFTSRVERVERVERGFVVHGRRGSLRASRIASNLLPAATARLFGTHAHALGGLGALDDAVQRGWGAVMSYRVVRNEGLLERGAHHVDLTLRPGEPLIEGNHVFCSVGADDEARVAGTRTVTMSTHVPGRGYLNAADPGAYVTQVQASMRRTVAALYPALQAATVHESSSSPRTFQRFVGRALVGGVPRTAGWSNYEHLGPTTFLPHAWLIGDSVFPGQSVLATAIGGTRAAEAAARAR